jgi:hypothetical protein
MAHAPLERTHDSSPNGVGNPGGGVQTLGIFVAFVEDVLLFAEVLDRRVRPSPAYRCARRYSPRRTIREKRLNTARTARESDVEDRVSGKIRRDSSHVPHPQLCTMSCQESYCLLIGAR